MRKATPFTLIILALAVSLTLTACGGGDDSNGGSNVAGDATRGETLYKQNSIGAANAPGCITCHSLTPDEVISGPSHNGIAIKAETAVAGQSAEEYLRTSIKNPDSVITEGFDAGVMYQNFGKDLSEQEISDLVAFMLTLK